MTRVADIRHLCGGFNHVCVDKMWAGKVQKTFEDEAPKGLRHISWTVANDMKINWHDNL